MDLYGARIEKRQNVGVGAICTERHAPPNYVAIRAKRGEMNGIYAISATNDQ